MLTELRISNFALIDQLHLEFPPGFLVLTGETGAGKSLLVDALTLLIGGRASSEHIRTETEEAQLEAAFSLSTSHSLATRLREMDLLAPGEQELVIRRVLSRSGRNRSYLNSHPVPLQLVQEFAGALVDIHGQHEQQSLLSSSSQLDVLDTFGLATDLRGQYEQAYRDWQTKEQQLEEAQNLEADRGRRQGILQFQHQELSEAGLQHGEEEQLVLEYQRLKHARRLGELTEQAYEALYGENQSVLGMMSEVDQYVKELSQIDSSLDQWNQLSESCLVQCRELVENLRAYRQEFEYDPHRLDEIDARLAKLQRLKKKYGGAIEELINQTQNLQEELESLSNSQELIENWRQQVSESYQVVKGLAHDLSTRRRQAAKELEKSVKAQLLSLSMKHIQFLIQITSHSDGEELSPTGVDEVSYLFSTNPGEPPLPLTRIASGGELSRVMLAMKTVLAGMDQVPVLIFDEIDSGIGGTVATVMGQQLRSLAKFHQVFCITHLPQIASQANGHFVVKKESINDRTMTSVHALNQKERKIEIARMLGSKEMTKAVKQTAREMLDSGAS